MALGVLITSASRKVALVRAFRDALLEVGGGRVTAADITSLAPALYAADAARLLPPSDDAGFVDALLQLCREEEISLIVPTRDAELPVMAAARDRAAAEGVRVLVPDAAAVAVCQDKEAFARACADTGLRTPRVVPRPTARDLPLFVRPRTGAGGHGARVVRTEVELAAAVSELGPLAFAQELVEARELTVDLFIDPRDGTPVSCVPRERLLIVAGESYVGRTVRDEALQDATIRLAAALRLTGHLTVQAFRRDDEILFIEVNPRYGGGAALGFAAGAPTPASAVRVAAGLPVEPRLGAHEVGLVMLRYTEDRFLRASELLGPVEP